MNYNILKYLIGEGFKSILKNKKSTFAALMIMFVTLLTVGLGIAGGINITSMVKQIEGEFPIQLFIEDEASQDEVKKMEDTIKSMDYVNNVTYMSKADALKNRRETLANSEVILKTYTDTNNPFPASFTITLTNLDQADDVIEKLNSLDNVKGITTQQYIIKKLKRIRNTVVLSFIVIGILLLLVSVVIIGNTIKLALQARKREISIMKYVGATNNFIRAPFIVEGIVMGILATAISLIALGGIYTFIYSKCGGIVLDNYSLVQFSALFSIELLIFAILGIGIGVLGSLISMMKYLKV